MNHTIHNTHNTHNIRDTRLVRTVVSAALVLGLAAVLGACSETVEQVDKAVDETYEVTYEVTGTNVDEIQFHAGGGKAMDPETETVTSPTLPWRKTVTLRGIMPPAVMPVVLDEDRADVACSITHEGKVIKKAEGEGLITAGGCVAVSPVAG
ncbi:MULTISPECIES: hypothetical protein [unclassified Streptomyces]|uniref:hypothetical protein n=1 Tax=unclassified Streptomyces TaxID=2593676 RepID=UPI0036E11D0F